ncbi:MAG: Bug family tripartite tricarboxylate transporter substrate binding protein [Pigmentiphaga sp.]
MFAKKILLGCVAVLSLGSVSSVAASEGWPTKPVRVLVAYPPGGAADLVARHVASHLQESFGQPFIVVNRPGGNTIIAADDAAKSPSDGYTFYISSPNIATLPTLFAGKLPFDPERDFVPVGLLSRVPFFIFVPKGLEVDSFSDLLAMAKENPGKLSYAYNGAGTTAQLGMELLKQRKGLDILPVPYKSNTSAQIDLAAGRVDIVMGDMTVGGGTLADRSDIQSDRVKVLAATPGERSAFLPNVPTIAEAGDLPGFDASIWFGMFAPTGTPQEIIERMNAAMAQYLTSNEAKEAFGKLGQEPAVVTPQELGDIVREQSRSYREVIEKAGIKIS